MTRSGHSVNWTVLGFCGFKVDTAARLGDLKSGGRDGGQREMNPLCCLKWPDRALAAHQLVRLDDFLRDNEETLTISEVQEICDALAGGRVHEGGGGAAERWTLEVF